MDLAGRKSTMPADCARSHRASICVEVGAEEETGRRAGRELEPALRKWIAWRFEVLRSTAAPAQRKASQGVSFSPPLTTI